MKHYERRLPHFDVTGDPLFITFRLYGSLPAKRIVAPEPLSTSGRAFVAMDRILDRAATGPRHLERPEIAQLVVAAIHDGDSKFHRYRLHAYVVMSNHVHVLLTPNVPSTKWLGPLKGFTAYRANELMGTHGRRFWQDESYDHRVRTHAEFERVRKYIEENPVKAGLTADARLFPWSSAAGADAA